MPEVQETTISMFRTSKIYVFANESDTINSIFLLIRFPVFYDKCVVIEFRL